MGREGRVPRARVKGGAGKPSPWLLKLLAAIAILVIVIGLPLILIHRRDQSKQAGVFDLVAAQADSQLRASEELLGKGPDSRPQAINLLVSSEELLARLDELARKQDDPAPLLARVAQLRERAAALHAKAK